METTEQIRTKEYRKSNEEKDSGVNIQRPNVTKEKVKKGSRTWKKNRQGTKPEKRKLKPIRHGPNVEKLKTVRLGNNRIGHPRR